MGVKVMKKIVCILVLLCVILGCFCSCIDDIKNQKLYDKGLSLLEEGRYGEAYMIFKNLGDYEDAAQIFSRFVYVRDLEIVTNPNGLSTYEIYYNEDNLPIQKIETDPDGRKIVWEYTYYSDGNLKSKSVVGDGFYIGGWQRLYKYDARNNLIKMTYINYNGVYNETYVYDDNNRLVEENLKPHGSSDTRMTYEYDANGNVVREVKYLYESVTEIKEYTYDVNGRLIRQVVRDKQRNSKFFDYEYDANGNVIKEVERNGKDEVVWTTNYVYDDAMRLIHEYYTDANGNDGNIRDYVYDEKGRLIREPGYEYTYDALGNVVKLKSLYMFQPNGEVHEYECRLVYIPYDLSELSEFTLTHLVDFLGNPFIIED